MEFITSLRHSTFDPHKPSLFELLSEAQLSSLLPPTLRYLLTVLTQRHPRYLLRVLNSFDELYALLFLAVERHYLLTRGGSFTEHFYGLKRERCLTREIPRAGAAAPELVRDATRLRSGDVWRNLAVLVGVPYLKRKLDEAFEIEAPRAAVLGRSYTTLSADAGVREKLRFYYRLFLRRVYPSVNALYYLSLLAFNLAYLFDRSKYHSPLLWLVGTRVRRMGAADYNAIEMLGKSAPGAGQRPGSVFSPRNLSARMLGGLSVLLPTSIFALKFLEWWYASDFAKQLTRRAAESLDLPPPVVAGIEEGKKCGDGQSEAEKEGTDEKDDEATLAEKAPIATPSLLPIFTVSAPEDSQLCPICGDEIVTATACQTGFVYCYTCIHRWIAGQHPRQEEFMKDRAGKWESGEGRCAVTGRRVLGGTEGLRRIMV
ncbi:putative peroxisome biosynthesis protein (PAS10/Peroxin-12) [Coniochaeta ligniaria NRRL 30616]|uniref:Peroxisome assembly protein 12 n=1 Tax=Coniochaeta ligniaria NRRL 30616 TaxID=1408157 RepID=A0A1J7IXK8_9PEZI|nr:putative peroxisome biosynthesis protein (PAS10/Peroxin-12) [Coniochaeta ligniaria NRRL 30616]